MQFSSFSVTLSAIFAVQMMLCWYGKKKPMRLLPLIICVGFEVICLIAYFAGKILMLEDSVSFLAFILGYLGLYITAMPILAWMTYGIIKIVQNKRK